MRDELKSGVGGLRYQLVGGTEKVASFRFLVGIQDFQILSSLLQNYI